MTKDMMAKALSEFIASKDVERMTLAEYKAFGNDVPVKDYMLRRAFGSWNRVMSVMKARYPILAPVVEPKVKPKATPKAAKKAKKEVKEDE
tara:strand:- start:297 stop:569 length:273 start_codon:yes stop_codon:yes gene_type:complete